MSVKGTVVRISAVKPLIQCMTFTCTRCGGDQEVRFSEGIYNPPTSCGLDGCRSKSFKPQKNTAQSIDWQKIRIQVLLSCRHPSRSTAQLSDAAAQGPISDAEDTQCHDDSRLAHFTACSLCG